MLWTRYERAVADHGPAPHVRGFRGQPKQDVVYGGSIAEVVNIAFTYLLGRS